MSVIQFLQKAVNLVPFRFRNSIKHIPGLKQLQALLLKRYADNREFVATISGGPAKGLVFPVKMPQDKGMWIGTWELDFAEMLAANVKAGFVCYDIGAYKGYYAGIMALKGASKVYVFEPMPVNAEKIKQLVSLNPSLPIELVQAAVSDTSGTAVFKLMPEETMGKLGTSSFQETEKDMQQIEVQCISLDALNGKYELPDFMKIDVEGAEEFVLKGGMQLLKEKKPVLMIEVHSPEIGKRCLQMLRTMYSSITVFETGKSPEEGTPEICHYIVKP
jgi:FkbM family methyltransferase